MLFLRTFFMTLFGVIMLVMAGILGFFLPFPITIMFVMLGAVLVVMSYIVIFMRAWDSTLYHLLEDPKASAVKWLYVYGDSEIIVAPAEREMEYQSYSKKLDAQIKEVKMYSFAGHRVRIVPEGIGHSIDLIKCLYAEVAKDKFKAKTLGKLREVLLPKQEEIPVHVKKEQVLLETKKAPKEGLKETIKLDSIKEVVAEHKENKYDEVASKVDKLTE